jgi:hypothetical protein
MQFEEHDTRRRTTSDIHLLDFRLFFKCLGTISGDCEAKCGTPERIKPGTRMSLSFLRIQPIHEDDVAGFARLQGLDHRDFM